MNYTPDTFHTIFSPIQHKQLTQLKQQNLYFQGFFSFTPSGGEQFLLTFTDQFIICSESTSIDLESYYTELDFELIFEIMFSDQHDLTSKKTGLKLFRSYHEPLTFYSNKKELNHNIVFYLARKINQKGFHERFKAIKKIGKGNFASVFEVKRIEDEKRFAVKAFSKVNTYSMPEGRDNLINELSVLRKIDHHNIVYLEGVYESENSIYVVLELIEGPQLYEKIAKKKEEWNLDQTKSIMKCLLKGLKHLHDRRIAHRDIKPENIILRNDKFQSPVIVDFGLATFCDIETYIYNKCGTPGFVPPEIITQKEPAHVEPLCDIFSLGALFHILLTRKQLFEGTSFQEVLHKNKHLMIKVNETVVKKADLNALDLLKKMIEVNPADRISADEALSHPFFTAMEEEKATATNL